MLARNELKEVERRENASTACGQRKFMKVQFLESLYDWAFQRLHNWTTNELMLASSLRESRTHFPYHAEFY